MNNVLVHNSDCDFFSCFSSAGLVKQLERSDIQNGDLSFLVAQNLPTHSNLDQLANTFDVTRDQPVDKFNISRDQPVNLNNFSRNRHANRSSPYDREPKNPVSGQQTLQQKRHQRWLENNSGCEKVSTSPSPATSNNQSEPLSFEEILTNCLEVVSLISLNDVKSLMR